MGMSYLNNEDDQSFTIQGEAGPVTYQKQPNFDVAGGVYDVARQAAAARQSAMPTVPVVPTSTSANAFNTMPQVAFPVPPVDTAMQPIKGVPQTATSISADPTRQPASRPQVAPPIGFGSGPSTVQLGSHQDIREQNFVDPAAMAAYDAEHRDMADSMNKRADAEGKIAAERGNAAGQQAALKTQMASDREAGAVKAEQQFNDYQSKYDTLYKDYSDTKIQPKGYFEGDLGGNILAGIGIMLGAVGGSLQGSNKNMAVEVMDRAIDRDLEAQKANLAKKGEALNMLGVRYQAARQAGFDDIQAKMLAKADAYDSIAAYTEAKVAPLQGTVIQQNGLMEAAKLRSESAKFKAESTKATQKTVNTTEDKIVEGKKSDAKPLPENVVPKVTGYVDAHYAMNELRDLAQTANVGPVEGRLQRVAAKLGIQDADDAKLQQAVDQYIQNRVHMLSGSGSSDKEREQISQTASRLFDNPEAFSAKLDAAQESNARSYYLLEKQYPEAGGYRWQDLHTGSPSGQRAHTTVYGKPSTFKANGK